jgi:hypothetical protein
MNLPVVDPVLAHACAGFVALVFLLGALDKLRGLDAFEGAIADYQLLPDAVPTRAVAWAIALVEGAAGLALLAVQTRPLGLVLGVALLAVVSGAVVINLLRGRTHIDCGCGGASGAQSLSWWLPGRNGVLALLAVIAVAPQGGRALAWLDGVTVVAATLALLALYVSFNQLRANAPRLLSLRR